MNLRLGRKQIASHGDRFQHHPPGGRRPEVVLGRWNSCCFSEDVGTQLVATDLAAGGCLDFKAAISRNLLFSDPFVHRLRRDSEGVSEGDLPTKD